MSDIEKIKKPGRLMLPVQDLTSFGQRPLEDQRNEQVLYYRRPFTNQVITVFRTSGSYGNAVNMVGEDDLYFFLRGLSEAANKTRTPGSFPEHRGLIINFTDDHRMTVEIYDDYKE